MSFDDSVDFDWLTQVMESRVDFTFDGDDVDSVIRDEGFKLIEKSVEGYHLVDCGEIFPASGFLALYDDPDIGICAVSLHE